MSFESDIVALLNPLCADQVFWDAPPEGVRITQPTVILSNVGGRGNILYLEQELSDKTHARIRVKVWAYADKQAACDLSRQVKHALMGSSFTVEPFGEFSGTYLQAVKLYENVQDFGILYADPDTV